MFIHKAAKGEIPAQAIIGMIHVLPLPGSVFWDGDFERLVQQAHNELTIYEQEKVDAVMIENMHDVPYAKPPLARETVDVMLRVAQELRSRTQLPMGIQMLEGANCEAMEIAAKADLDFIRAEGYVYAHVGGAGLIEGSARKILQLRKELKAEHIKVFADVKKKHCAHALTADLSLKDVVKQTDFFCADGIIVTGSFTGEPVKVDDLVEAKNATCKPIIIGSGITPDNLHEFFDHADAFIVGTYCKKDDNWKNPVAAQRVRRLVTERDRLRSR